MHQHAPPYNVETKSTAIQDIEEMFRFGMELCANHKRRFVFSSSRNIVVCSLLLTDAKDCKPRILE